MFRHENFLFYRYEHPVIAVVFSAPDTGADRKAPGVAADCQAMFQAIVHNRPQAVGTDKFFAAAVYDGCNAFACADVLL